jgi:outer membrane protein TolC
MKNKTIFLSGSLWLVTSTAVAQSASNAGARVQQVPLSGQQGANSVAVEQSAASAAGSSVNTINSSIDVQGRYQGSVSDPQAVGASLTLTLEDAIRRGLQFNLGAVSANTSLRQVRAQRLAALSQMLPNINASLSMTEEKENLQALGLSSSTLASEGLPFAFPKTVGPFHYYDARGTVSEDAFDLTALHNYRSAKELQHASELSARDAHELVVLAVAGEYLNVLASEALVESQAAQVAVAEKNRTLALDTLRQSQDRFAAGVTDSVEVVQSQQSLAAAESDYINSLFSQNLAKINLWRVTGEAEQNVSGLLKGN